MSRFEYPRLSRSEIVGFLTESQIIPNITEYHLADPSHDFVCDIYTRLLIHLDSFNEDDGMDFDALALLENPDFHVESIRKMNLYRRVKEVISSLDCPKDFTLKDILKPTVDRTEIFISAILNFCFYKDNKINLLETILNELNLLHEQQKEWGERISMLNDDIARHNETRENERPLVQEVESKVRELQQTISELNNHQMSLRTAHRKLKEKSAELETMISSAEFSLVQSVQENANLRSKIVQSPDKLQGALEEKKSLREEALNAEKLAKQAFEEKSTMVEIYTKASKKMTKHLTQLEKIQEQINSSKSIEKELKLLKAKLIDEGLLDKQLDAKLMELNGRVEQLEEQKKIMYNERQVKIEEATRELDNVKQEVESRKQDLQTSQRKVAATVAEAEANTLKSNQVKDSSSAKQHILLNKMEEIVKEFRQYSSSMRSVMQNVETGK